MNKDLSFIKDKAFRFDPKSCRSANVTLMEAKFLHWIFLAERSSTDINGTFGLGLAGRGSWITRWANKV